MKGESSERQKKKKKLTRFTPSTTVTSATDGYSWNPPLGSERHSKGRGKTQPTATQYSTYSDVGPDVGGGDYGAPRCPVRCESLNQ